MRMHNPPHPAEVIREDILPELGLSVTEAARQLGVSRVTLSRLLNGKAGISADMAIRLHKWLGDNSPSPESWLHQQADYDLWQAMQKTKTHAKVTLQDGCRRTDTLLQPPRQPAGGVLTSAPGTPLSALPLSGRASR